MSQFKRKEQGGFQASDRPSAEGDEPLNAPDFSALEVESGFSAGELDSEPMDAVEAPRPVQPRSEPAIPARPVEAPKIAPSPVQPAKEGPAKKRYYSPNEVMRKKGCIGCGGMALAVPFVITALGIAIAVL